MPIKTTNERKINKFFFPIKEYYCIEQELGSIPLYIVVAHHRQNFFPLDRRDGGNKPVQISNHVTLQHTVVNYKATSQVIMGSIGGAF